MTSGQVTAATLDRSLVSGIAWTGAVRWGVQAFTWVATLVIYRLLDPADFGLVGMATGFVGLMAIINEFGFGAAIVQQRRLDDASIARVGALAIAGGIGLAALSAVFAGPVAVFFAEPGVAHVVPALSLGFVMSGAQVVPRALLARDLEFRRIAWLDGVEGVTGSLVTLIAAWVGLAHWALVVGPLSARAITTLIANVWRPHVLAWPRDTRGVSAPLRFGSNVVIARLAWYVYANADFVVVGRLLGKATLGAYTIAWTLASVPVDRIGALVAGVTFPVFARVQDDPAALRRYLLRLTEGLALLTFPAAVGLALVADELVLAVAGDQWNGAIVPLQLLSLAAALRSVTPLLPQLLVAVGQARRNAQVTVVIAIVLPLLFILGSRWGVAGVGIAWLLGHPLVVVPAFLVPALRITSLRLDAYVRAFAPAAMATAAMAGAVLSVRYATPSSWPVAAQLALHVLAGAVTYTCFLRLAYADQARAFVAFLREIRSPTPSPP